MNAMKQNGSEPIKVTVSNTVARDNICLPAGNAPAGKPFFVLHLRTDPWRAFPLRLFPAVALAPPGCRLS